MANHDIIVVGASAGGVEALIRLTRELPADLPAALFVVLHVPAESPSLLADILNRSGPLLAQHAVDGTPIVPGQIYVAPPDHHTLVERGQMRVVRGPRENRHRPAIDPLFRTAARAYGPRVIGVVLTGMLDDGTAGLHAIKQCGGITVVQDPSDALYPSMPQSALAHVEIDVCRPLAELAPLLVELARTEVPAETSYPVSDELELEARIARLDPTVLHRDHGPGAPSQFSCPECGGVLWEIDDGALTRFRCRSGHAYSTESMLVEQNQALEQALWVALKALEEQGSLSRRIARNAQERGQPNLVERFQARALQSEQQAEIIRRVLMAPPVNS